MSRGHLSILLTSATAALLALATGCTTPPTGPVVYTDRPSADQAWSTPNGAAPEVVRTDPDQPQTIGSADVVSRSAAALVFEPNVPSGRVTGDQGPLQISRDGRGLAAYGGFVRGQTTFYEIRVDDRQLESGRLGRGRWSGLYNQSERRTLSRTVGVLER